MAGNPFPVQLQGTNTVVVADGGNTTQGTIADAAVTGDNPGTVNAHLRGITKQLSVALPLPTGASTEATLAAILADTNDIEASLPAALVGGRLDVNIGASPATVPSSVADGSNVTLGAIADTAVTGDNTGTVNAHLRGLDKILAAIWNTGISPNSFRASTVLDDNDGGSPTLRALGYGTQGPNNLDGNSSKQYLFISGIGSAVVWSQQLVSAGNTIQATRTCDTFKKVSATASGSTALWTPTTGKKFRLMRFIIIVSANSSAAAAAVKTIKLLDGASDINLDFDCFVPTTAVVTGGPPMMNTGWIDLGNGFLSSAANNVLNINLSTALSTGTCNVIACGTEE